MRDLTVVVDLQFGSTGKGLICGHLAEKGEFDVIVNANMPNAGHTFINKEGRVWMHKVLPNGIVGESVKKVMIGPGSIFSRDVLTDEVRKSEDILQGKEILIHQDAMMLNEHHSRKEFPLKAAIGSTAQGSAAAMMEKIARDATQDDNRVISQWLDPYLKDHVRVIGPMEWAIIMKGANNVLLEGAQGYSLGINAGFWPFCTSRDCTPQRFMADASVPFPSKRMEIIGTARVHPIRVGGNSGPWYLDQVELTWGELGIIPERTTVTKRVRRVATFSVLQIREAIAACTPTGIFLNFCNYSPGDTDEAIKIISRLDSPLAYLGYGPRSNDVEAME